MSIQESNYTRLTTQPIISALRGQQLEGAYAIYQAADSLLSNFTEPLQIIYTPI